jgi:hypothetical protein
MGNDNIREKSMDDRMKHGKSGMIVAGILVVVFIAVTGCLDTTGWTFRANPVHTGV